jgi:1-acyl-sn-glycerol-3-phosphate acyltransferase
MGANIMSRAAQDTIIRNHHPRWVVWLGNTLLRLTRFERVGERPDVPKCVVTAAPHTSNWDYFYTLLVTFALDIPMAVLIKDDWFFWPIGPFLRWFGGVPVNRKKHTNLVLEVVRVFNERSTLFLVITPEGTRSEVKYWKSGFYWVAQNAGVPVLPAFIDYAKRRVGFGSVIPVTGDIEADFANIRALYEQEVGVTFQLNPKDTKNAGKDAK